MRLFTAPPFALLTSFAFACSSLGGEDPNESNGSSTSPATGATVPTTGGTNSVPVTPATSSVPSLGGGGVTPSTTVTPSSNTSSGAVSPTTGAPAPPPSNDEAEAPATGDGGTTPPVQNPAPDNSTPGNNASPDTTSEPAPGPECTDTPPDDRQTCQTWAEWGECDEGWLKDPGFCAASCDRCESGNMSVAPQPQPDPGVDATNDNDPEPMPDPGGNAGDGDPGGDLGDDNPFGQVQGGQQGNSTRYWDCCKQSCGWTANASQAGAQPVHSCQAMSGQNIGANDADKSVCDGNPGNAQTCHGMAPWAHSNQVSFGYAAANGAGCGTCWQLQFTGTANGGQAGDEGAQRIQGKTMVVMATNIGDLNGALHFDLLIPGGGVGLAQGGCPVALGFNEQELGANRGGFRTDCAGAGSQDAIKQCVRDKCSSVFGSRGLSDLEAGCLWYADWFEAADNPDFVVQQIDCPAELRVFN